MSKCVKLDTKKYKTRDSPPYSAMDCKGATLLGNDGHQYVSKADKNGIYKWVKIAEKLESATCITDLHRNSPPFYKYAYKKSLFAPVIVSKFLKCLPPGIIKDTTNKPKHIYEILDNRATPFLVFDYGGHVDVYNQKYNEASNHYEIKGKIMQSKYINIFVGDNDLKLDDYELKKGEGRGNTILLQTGKNKYVYIGDGIRSFTTKNDDIIKKYYSPVGNNVVPYPYAIGEKYVYIMLHNMLQPVEDFDLKKDAYMQYYGWHIKSEHQKNYHKKYMDRRIEYPVKVLFKRFF
jgi:hypothetical protein